MVKIFSTVTFIFCLLFITACSSNSNNNNDTTETQEETASGIQTETSSEIQEETPSETQVETSNEIQDETHEEEENMIPVNLIINSQTFSAVFYDNETTQAFIEQMPITLNMSDLNNNEKYYNLPNNLPTENTERPDVIHAGEIMVWRANTIVVFYETFSNSFSGYTRLGFIENIDGLVEALGPQNVDVTFELNN